MPMNKDVWGPNVANAVATWSAANVPQDRTTFITNSELVDLWKVITQEHKAHLNDNADIQLLSNDIHVAPGTFIDSVDFNAITGQGENLAVTLTQKIK